MRITRRLLAIPLLFLACSCGAITIEDLVGTYVGKWTENLPDGVVNRYESVAVFDPDSRVTTYTYSNPPFFGQGSGILEIEEDGSFVIGEGDALGQLTLNGKHLHVVVRWRDGAVVDFKGHLSDKLPDWFPDFDRSRGVVVTTGADCFAPCGQNSYSSQVHKSPSNQSIVGNILSISRFAGRRLPCRP